MLGIDDHTLTASKFAKVDAMTSAVESKLNSSVKKSLALQPFTDTGLHQQSRSSLLQLPGADPFLDAFAAGDFQDHGLDALKMQEMREHQTGGAGTDDSPLGVYFHGVMGSRTASMAFVRWLASARF